MNDRLEKRTSPALGFLIWIAAIAGSAAWLHFAADNYFRGLLYTTFWLAAHVTLLTVPLAALIALILTRTDALGGRFWPLLCAAPLILPSFVLIAGWDAMIGPIGWAKAWLPMDTAMSTVRWWSAVMLHSLLALPVVVLLLSLGFSRGEAELEETALLSWSWPRVLLSVTVRRTAPLFLAASAWIFISVSGEIAVTDIYQIRTIAEELYQAYQSSEFRGLTAYILLLGVVACAAIHLTETSLRTEGLSPGRLARRFSLGLGRIPVSLFLGALFLLLVATPLASLIYKAGLHVQHYDSGHPFQTWTLTHVWETLAGAPRQFAPELSWTAQHALLTGALSMCLGLTLAWSERCWLSLTNFNSLLIVLAMVLPGPLVAIGLLKALSSSGDLGIYLRDRTLFPLIAASTIRSLPWVLLFLRHAFRTIPQEQLEVARLEGWGAGRILFGIALPQRWPLLGAALVFCIALSVSEVASSLLLYPPGVELASVRMMGMLHSGVDNQLAGLALLLLGFYSIGLLALALLLNAQKRFQ